MTNQMQVFQVGDWLIHIHYGVGQVIDIEEKSLYGDKELFYRVRTQENNGIFWVPLDQAIENERIRPLATQSRLQEAFALLQKPPRVMSEENKVRKERIFEARSKLRLLPIARLIRDLSARQATHPLTQIEANALENFKKRLLSEWAVQMEIPIHSARLKLNHFLAESQAHPLRPAA